MKVATRREVAADSAEYVKATRRGPVVLTSKGKPVAVLLGADGADDLERLLMGHSPKLQSILEPPANVFEKDAAFPRGGSGRRSKQRPRAGLQETGRQRTDEADDNNKLDRESMP